MINKIKNNIFQLYFKEFGSCVYILKLNKLVLIDTSSSLARQELLSDLKELKIDPKEIEIIIITHQHADHNKNLNLFKNAKIYDFKNIEEIEKEIKGMGVIKTPGHTHDSICLLYKDILFSGDTLFHNGIGRTDLQDSEPEKMLDSLEKLKRIKYKILCPGHID